MRGWLCLNALCLSLLLGAGSLGCSNAEVERASANQIANTQELEVMVIRAVRESDLDALAHLADKIAFTSITRTSSKGYDATLLHITEDCEVAKFLMESGVSPYVADDLGRKPIHEAAVYGWVDMLECYVSLGVPVDEPTDAWKLDTGFDLSTLPDEIAKYPELYYGLRLEGFSSLHLAASTPSHSQLEIIHKLIELGCDPDVTGPFQLTPLHVAALGGSSSGTMALLEAGANRKMRTESNFTAYELAEFQYPEDHAGPKPLEVIEEIQRMLMDTE